MIAHSTEREWSLCETKQKLLKLHYVLLWNQPITNLDSCVLVMVHSDVKNWIKYARFEEKNQYVNSCRRIYERAVQFFGQDNISEQLLIAFARFEEGQKEVSL